MTDELTKYAKNPWNQLIVVLIILAVYWSWDVVFTHGEEYTQVQQRMVPDSTMLESDSLQRIQPYDYGINEFVLPPEFYGDSAETEASDPIDRSRRPSSENAEQVPAEQTMLYKWIDMILGHLSSILGSLAMLAVPAYNFWKQRNQIEE